MCIRDSDNGSVDFCNFPVNIDTTLSLPGIPNVSASIAAGGGGGTIDTSSFALIDEPNTFECNQIFEGNVVIQENFGDSDHHIRTICSDGIGSTTIFDVTNERLFHAFTVNIGLANNVDCNYAGVVGDGLCVNQGRMFAVGQYNTPPLTGDRFVVGGGINSTNETTLLRVNDDITEINANTSIGIGSEFTSSNCILLVGETNISDGANCGGAILSLIHISEPTRPY